MLNERSQIHFNSSTSKNVHSTPNSLKQPFTQTQLKFNLSDQHALPPFVCKPRPIIIEKLMPRQVAYKEQTVEIIKDGSVPSGAVLSSDKLAMAVQLAKMDINRLKSMLSASTEAAQFVPTPIIKPKDKKKDHKPNKAVKCKSAKKQEPRYSVHVYPQPSSTDEKSLKPANESGIKTRKDEKEISRLEKELFNYSKTLEQVINNLNSQNQRDRVLDNQEERQRQLHQAEEQTSRSSRMLYTLQHKVEHLQRELNQDIHHTKKSQSVANLASAHRSAIRALQLFVDHAPLYYNVNGKLPPMYKNLGLLVQQLSEISTGASSDKTKKEFKIAINDLISTLNGATIKSYGKDTNAKSKRSYLNTKENWLKNKADKLNIPASLEKDCVTTTDRASKFHHAMEDFDQSEFKKPSRKSKFEAKQQKKSKSLLLPYKLQKARSTMPHSKYLNNKNMNFAAPTVLSRIRGKPTIEKQHSSSTPLKKKKNEINFRKARLRDEYIIKEAKQLHSPPPRAPISPSHAETSPPLSPKSCIHYSKSPPWSHGSSVRSSPHRSPLSLRCRSPPMRFMNKEIQKHMWLDRYKKEELLRLNKVGKITEKEFNQLRKELRVTAPLILNAEKEIREKLEPLLRKAEEIADEEAKREENYKSSINQRLADVASQKALSEGERLAEYILDDLIMEAALEFQAIDSETQAEVEATFMSDRPTLENVEQRLKCFEDEEEAIRRYYQSASYSNVSLDKKDGDNLYRPMFYTSRKMANECSEHIDESVNKRKQKLHTTMIDVPDEVLHCIKLHKKRFEVHLEKKPFSDNNLNGMSNELSDEILDKLLYDIAQELSNSCDNFVDEVFEHEFLHIT